MIKDHYATLGLDPASTPDRIRKARNALLRKNHPDFNPGRENEAKEKTIDILLAAEILLDPAAREEYDRMHKNVFGRFTGGEAPPRRPAAGPFNRQPPRPAEHEIIYCTRCGRKNSKSARDYCIFCGKGLGENAKDFTREDLENILNRTGLNYFIYQYQYRTTPNKQFGPLIIIALCVIAVLILIFSEFLMDKGLGIFVFITFFILILVFRVGLWRRGW